MTVSDLQKYGGWIGQSAQTVYLAVLEAAAAVVHDGVADEIGTRGALTDAVYKDESKRLWYQMAAGSTIYHFGKHRRSAAIEAVWQDTVRGQNDTPVFKLISPDNTDGS